MPWGAPSYTVPSYGMPSYPTGGEYGWQQKMLGTMGSGNPYGVGSPQGPHQLGVGAPIGGDPNAGWGQALQDAYKQSQSSYDQGLKNLGTQFSTGPFGQGLSAGP